MDIKKVIEITNNIRKAKEESLERLREIEEFHEEVINNCGHDLIIRIWDGRPKKKAMDCFYCPACEGRFMKPFHADLTPDAFKDIRIIDLQSPVIDGEVLDIIRNEIINNYDYYLENCNSQKLDELLKNNVKAKKRTR